MQTDLLLKSCAVACLCLLLSGCSTRMAYDSAQGWQRQQCFKLEDPQQRQRCLKSASGSYEDYQLEVKTLPAATKP